MRIDRKLAVAAPLERVFAALQEIDRVIADVPAADRLTVWPLDADVDERSVSLRVRGRAGSGPGIGGAVVECRLADERGRTSLQLAGELRLAGLHADPQVVMEEIDPILEDVASQLERRAASGAPTPPRSASETERVPAEPPVLGVPPEVARPAAASVAGVLDGDRRLAIAAGLVPLALLAGFAAGRVPRRSRGTISVSYRW